MLQDRIDLYLKKEERQVSSHIYSMGEEIEDVLESFRLSDDEQMSYKTVRGKFATFFCEEDKHTF